MYVCEECGKLTLGDDGVLHLIIGMRIFLFGFLTDISHRAGRFGRRVANELFLHLSFRRD